MCSAIERVFIKKEKGSVDLFWINFEKTFSFVQMRYSKQSE